MKKRILAVDLGASSGRGILGEFNGEKLALVEVNRFQNMPKQLGGQYYWDIISIIDNIYKAIYISKPDSVGVNTWGVDFGMLDKSGNLMYNPMSYRDPSFSKNNMKEVADLFGGADELFSRTGVALVEYNSLCQLYHLIKSTSLSGKDISKILMLPNLIEYFLSGSIHCEYSIISTSQLFNMFTKEWDKTILNKLGFDQSVFPECNYAGKKMGNLLECNGIKSNTTEVISVAGHDTACAVSAVPSLEPEFAFISSGTWSLMGMVSNTMITDAETNGIAISNEGTYNGLYRPTVNINGLWVIQECKRQWDNEGKNYSYDDIVTMANKEKEQRCFIDIDIFMNPGNYPKMIQEYCSKTNQYIPQTDGEIARCVFESLAMKYKHTYLRLEDYMSNKKTINIIGGGVNNELLNQMTADALGINVVTGPSEATAIGNLIIQMEALGEISGRRQAIDIINQSYNQKEYIPRNTIQWEESYQKYLRIIQNGILMIIL